MIKFRNKGIFYEAVTNQILDDLVAAIQPRRMTVVGDFSVRGGIKNTVSAEYAAEAAETNCVTPQNARAPSPPAGGRWIPSRSSCRSSARSIFTPSRRATSR